MGDALSKKQIRSIAHYFHEPVLFLLFDARRGLEQIHAQRVFQRAWAEEGYIGVSMGGSEDLVRVAGMLQVPISLVVSAETFGDASVQDFFRTLGEAFQAERLSLVRLRDEGGKLFRAGGIPLSEGPFMNPAGASVVKILCSSRRVFKNKLLPMEIQVDCFSDDRRRWTIGVEIQVDPRETIQAAWYRLSGPESGKLVVMIDPATTGDSLRLTYAGEPATPVPAPVDPDGPSIPLTHLGLILDRTCPDSRHWGKALYLALDIAAPERRSIYDEENQNTVAPSANPDTTEPPDFNSDIRNGLSDELASHAEDGALTVHGFWFADTSDSALVFPEHFTPPRDRVGTFGGVPAANAHGFLDAAGYTPGIDIWDPVEEALVKALDSLKRYPDEPRGIVIVGNSPPHYPAQSDSPFAELLEFPGFKTSFRRRNPTWHMALDGCMRENIPVVYLFLWQDAQQFASQEQLHDLMRFWDLHTRVLELLERCMPVVRADACRESVALGLKKALEKLSDPLLQTTSVRVKHELA